MNHGITRDAAARSTDRRSTSVLAALLAAIAIILGGFSAASPALAATATIRVDNDTVQLGSSQTFFPSGFKANGILTAKLTPIGGGASVSDAGFKLGADGKPLNPYPRIEVPATAAVGDYTLSAKDGRGGSASVTIHVVAQATEASVAVIDMAADFSSITVQGQGWLRRGGATNPVVMKDRTPEIADDALYPLATANSLVGVKLELSDGNTRTHADTAGDYAPVPRPYASGGASPRYTWYYVGNPGITSSVAPADVNGASGYPNPAYASYFNGTGAFTATIPLPADLPSGTHTLRFLSGTLANTAFNEGASYKDAARSIELTFTTP